MGNKVTGSGFDYPKTEALKLGDVVWYEGELMILITCELIAAKQHTAAYWLVNNHRKVGLDYTWTRLPGGLPGSSTLRLV